MRIRQPHYTLFIIYVATGCAAFHHPLQGMKTPPAQRLDIQCFAKGRLLQSKRRPFSVRFAAFYNAKGGILGSSEILLDEIKTFVHYLIITINEFILL